MIELMNTKPAFKLVVGQSSVAVCRSEHCSASAGTAQGYNAEKTAQTAQTTRATRAARKAAKAAAAEKAAAAAEAAAATKAAGAASMQRIAELMMRPLRRQQEMLHHLRIIQEALDTPPIPTPSENQFVAKKKPPPPRTRTTTGLIGTRKDQTIAKKKPAVKRKKG